MDEKKALIRFELKGDNAEIEIQGDLFETLNLLLNGIHSMFEEPWEQGLFKGALKSLYKRWDEEAEEAEEGADDSE